MRSRITVVILFIFNVSTTASNSIVPDHQASLEATFYSMPLVFTENQGQWPDSILYRASAGGVTMWFTPTGAYYQFIRRIARTENAAGIFPKHPLDKSGKEPDSLEFSMIKDEIVGANLNPSAKGHSLMEYKCNYFIGNEPDKWRTRVPNYESIQYQEVYPGIDLKYYGNGRQMEYDFIVSPGADYRQIQIRYDGAESLTLEENGDLIIKTAFGELRELQPRIHQIVEGRKVAIAGNYVLGPNNTFSFELDCPYNPELALVIDPPLVYSSYLGGSGEDIGYDIAVDAAGAVYVMGNTASPIFPTLDPFQTDQVSFDVFVSKLNNSGSGLVYSTYLGGNQFDLGRGIAVDAAGAAFVTGSTSSTDFPTLNSYQNDQGDYDIFVTKLSSAGSSLVYSTYLGGSSIGFGSFANDKGNGIAVDAAGAAYVTGTTTSSDFPTLNPYQTYQGAYDVIVAKLNSAGSGLVYSTYLGGSDWDLGNGIAVDAAGAAYVGGISFSDNFPTFDQYQTDQAGEDAFVTKLSGTGSSLVYSTYLGGNGGDTGFDIAVDFDECVYVTGYTSSTDFPTLNPYQTYQGPVGFIDAYVTKFSSAGNSLVYSTYLGGRNSSGSANEEGYGIAVDAAGAAYVTGYTNSTDFPILYPYQTYQGGGDVFVTKLSSTGSSLIHSTYLGGNFVDFGNGIAVDAAGAAYVTGNTSSPNFPTLNPYQANQGEHDVFVTKFSCCISNRGDCNNDGSDANILDLNFLVTRIFRGGPVALCPEEGDINSNGTTSDILDLNYLVNRIFRGGPPPGAC